MKTNMNLLKIVRLSVELKSNEFECIMITVLTAHTRRVLTNQKIFESNKYTVALNQQCRQGLIFKLYAMGDWEELAQHYFSVEDVIRPNKAEGLLQLSQNYVKLKRGDINDCLIMVSFTLESIVEKNQDKQCEDSIHIQTKHYKQIGKKNYSLIIEKAIQLYLKQKEQEKQISTKKQITENKIQTPKVIKHYNQQIRKNQHGVDFQQGKNILVKQQEKEKKRKKQRQKYLISLIQAKKSDKKRKQKSNEINGVKIHTDRKSFKNKLSEILNLYENSPKTDSQTLRIKINQSNQKFNSSKIVMNIQTNKIYHSNKNTSKQNIKYNQQKITSRKYPSNLGRSKSKLNKFLETICTKSLDWMSSNRFVKKVNGQKEQSSGSYFQQFWEQSESQINKLLSQNKVNEERKNQNNRTKQKISKLGRKIKYKIKMQFSKKNGGTTIINQKINKKMKNEQDALKSLEVACKKEVTKLIDW